MRASSASTSRTESPSPRGARARCLRSSADGSCPPRPPARRRGRRKRPGCARLAGAVTNRNWSPSGTDCSTIAPRSGASRYCSTARLSGRAPSSGLKPFSMRNAYADSSTSTAHGRPRRPRRASASASSLSSSARIADRSNGRKTTTRSKRFTSSGRNDARTARSIPAAGERATPGSKPTRGASARAASRCWTSAR